MAFERGVNYLYWGSMRTAKFGANCDILTLPKSIQTPPSTLRTVWGIFRAGTSNQVDHFQGCLQTDLQAQLRYGQGFSRATNSERWTSPMTSDCKPQRSQSLPPCRAARPRPFDKHVQGFYRLHLGSTKFARQGSECLQPARCEFAKAARRSSCLGITIPKRCSSVSGCEPPFGNKSPRSARSSAPSATSFAITSTASASGFTSRGIHAAFTSVLLRSTTTHAALR